KHTPTDEMRGLTPENAGATRNAGETSSAAYITASAQHFLEERAVGAAVAMWPEDRARKELRRASPTSLGLPTSSHRLPLQPGLTEAAQSGYCCAGRSCHLLAAGTQHPSAHRALEQESRVQFGGVRLPAKAARKRAPTRAGPAEMWRKGLNRR